MCPEKLLCPPSCGELPAPLRMYIGLHKVTYNYGCCDNYKVLTFLVAFKCLPSRQ